MRFGLRGPALNKSGNWWDAWTEWVTRATGSQWAFTGNVIVVLIWFGTGPFLGWSETWHFYANTSTTILTYLMVFVIQHSQNKNDQATQLKLDELVKALQGARSELAGIDQQSEQVIQEVRDADRR